MEVLETKLAELEAQLAQLLAENEQFKKREHLAQKQHFEELIEVILRAVDEGDKLESDYKNLLQAIEKDQLLIDLTEANNPNSEVLGFQFMKVILDSIEKHFSPAITDTKVKSRFLNVVKKVVKSPVLAAVLSTNPVTGAVYSIIDKVTSFTTNHPVGKKVKDLTIETRSVFQEDRIKGFYTDMEKYILFYDSLLQASAKYDAAVDNLKQKNKSLTGVLNHYHTDVLKDLGVDLDSDKPKLMQVDKILSPPPLNGGTLDYGAITSNEKVINAHKRAVEFSSLKERYESLRIDYNNIVVIFLDAYLDAFEKAEGFTDKSIDKSKLTDLKDRISNMKKITA